MAKKPDYLEFNGALCDALDEANFFNGVEESKDFRNADACDSFSDLLGVASTRITEACFILEEMYDVTISGDIPRDKGELYDQLCAAIDAQGRQKRTGPNLVAVSG